MKKTMAGFAAILIAAGPASAELYTLVDNMGGNAYGDTQGVVVDVDTAYNAFYNTPLVAGQQYSVDSVTLYDNNGNTTPMYLEVFDSTFAGFTGDTSASYLGHSSNAIDFSAAATGAAVTWNFTGINVTADSDGALSGSGLLYFFWDTDTTRDNFGNGGGVNSIFRMDAGDASASLGSAIRAYGSVQAFRSPEIQVQLTAIPEPATFGMVAAFGAGILFVRRRLMM